MRRRIVLIASALAACTPPATTTTSSQTTETTTTVAACNTLEPDRAKLVQLRQQPTALADLSGGPITPGVYDLSGGYVSGGAPEWTATRTAALEVSESGSGVAFNYAGVGSNLEERWTGAFSEGPPAGIDYSCGLTGHVDVTFAAQANQLQLRVPDPGGAGSQTLIFTRRS